MNYEITKVKITLNPDKESDLKAWADFTLNNTIDFSGITIKSNSNHSLIVTPPTSKLEYTSEGNIFYVFWIGNLELRKQVIKEILYHYNNRMFSER